MTVDELVQMANQFYGYAIASGILSSFALIESHVTDSYENSLSSIAAGASFAIVTGACIYKAYCLENKVKKRRNDLNRLR